jgi:hypothetical protein
MPRRFRPGPRVAGVVAGHLVLRGRVPAPVEVPERLVLTRLRGLTAASRRNERHLLHVRLARVLGTL